MSHPTPCSRPGAGSKDRPFLASVCSPLPTLAGSPSPTLTGGCSGAYSLPHSQPLPQIG
jgi:hypothetical protein